MPICAIKIGNKIHSESTSQWVFELSIRKP